MAAHRKPHIIIPMMIGLLSLLPITPLQAQPARAESSPPPAPNFPARTLTDKERLAVLGKLNDRRGYIVMCGDGVLIPVEKAEKWVAAAATPAELGSRKKLMESVMLHAGLIAALMYVTDPEIYQAIRTPHEELCQSIITSAGKCGIQLTREDIAKAPSAVAYLSALQTKSSEEIQRLITGADAPQKTFDDLVAFVIRANHARDVASLMKALYYEQEK